MKGDLAALKVALSRVEARTEKTFDREVDGFWCVQVDGEINNTVGTETEDGEKFEAAVVDAVTDEVTTGRGKGVGRHLGE